MAVIFPKSSDIIIKVAGIVVGIGALIGVAAFTYYTYPTVIDTGYQPVQPVPYSHKLHAGQLGLDCLLLPLDRVQGGVRGGAGHRDLHELPHARSRQDSPRLEPVRQSYATGQPVPWVQIHRLPDYVYFNHSAHLYGGRELRELPWPHRPDDRSPSGEAAEYGFVPGMPPRPGAECAAGGIW